MIADVDGDGADEIAFGHQDGHVRAYEADGSLRWASPAVPGIGPGCSGQGSGTAVDSSPAVADVDGDGADDIVFASWDFLIRAVDGNGTPLPGFPVDNDDTVWSSPVLHDVDGDGRMEIFVGGDSTPGGFFDHQGGVFRALDWSPAGVAHLWHRTANEVFHSSPAIGDVSGDGRADVVVGVGYDYLLACGGCASDHAKGLGLRCPAPHDRSGLPRGRVGIAPVVAGTRRPRLRRSAGGGDRLARPHRPSVE